MKKFSAALATALLVACMGVGVALLASCSNSSESPAATPAAPTTPTNTETPTTPAAPCATTYTVTFDTDGGSAVDSQTVTSGQKATKPTDPTKTDGSINYFFVGWYNGNVFYDFNSAVSADITLTAKWFVKVAAGTYDGSAALTPASKVFIIGRTVQISALYVCDHEVTQGEYETYCKYGGTAPSEESGKGAGTNFPAYYVSWYDAAIYCNLRTIAEFGGEDQCVYTLNGKAHPKDWPGIVGNAADKYCGPSTTTDDWDYKGGSDVGIKFDPTKKGYRLPTEAEWEYIARNKNADSFTYSGSDTIGEVAWCVANSNGKTHKIKTASKANGLGIYDMSGNVDEWCHDWYDDITASTDPLGAPSGSRRVNRGGCWYSNDGNCSVAFRDVIYPHYRHYNLGFRVVRAAQ